MTAHKFAHQKNLKESQMIEDPIVAELRQHRKKHAAEHGNNLQRIVETLRKSERESKRKLLNPGPKLCTESNFWKILQRRGRFQKSGGDET